MGSLFSPPTINMPTPPAPIPPPTMPDPFNPASLANAKVVAAHRAGRSATELTKLSTNPRGSPTIAGGGSVPYMGTTLGGGR